MRKRTSQKTERSPNVAIRLFFWKPNKNGIGIFSTPNENFLFTQLMFSGREH